MPENFDSYAYFPQYIRWMDETCNKCPEDGLPILKKLCGLIDNQADAAHDLILGLLENIDINKCDASFVDYIAFLLGEKIPGTWSEYTRRQFLRILPSILRIKGTHPGFQKRAAFAGERHAKLLELYKKDLNEYFFYSQVKDSEHTLHSARVDVAREVCTDSCESICEAEGEELETLPPTQGIELVNNAGEVLPVHVLVRRSGLVTELSSPVFAFGDTLGCCISCETVCQTACESDSQTYGGSECGGYFSDSFPTTTDGIVVDTICLSTCESTCQTCCECGAVEGPCSSDCQIQCQTTCESLCQEYCMLHGCQSACQAGTCQQMCEVVCQTSCEAQCESMCEESCQGTCETGCETSCETGCETHCQVNCQVGGEG